MGTADELMQAEPVDLIIFGFCLYLVDPQDLFTIAIKSDQILSNEGYIAIYDFHPPMGHYCNTYTHKDGIFSYKMDYIRLFSWHPAYCSLYQQLFHHQYKDLSHFTPDDLVSVQILRKDYHLLKSHNPYNN